jgi:hypothetical protein
MSVESNLKHRDLPIVFIVGNSRSGTTMMMRMMNNHSQVHSINEPHFFEQMWSVKDEGQPIDRDTAERLYARLFTRQRIGFFESPEEHGHKFADEIEALIRSSEGEPQTRLSVYASFLRHETAVHGKSIPCEKTPRNVFYLEEIFRNFPNARVINMVRDPRSTMLSQKKKWRRRKLGATFMTRKEALRLRINYHPITMSQLWNAAISAARKFEGEERMMTVRFEDMVGDAEGTLNEICRFLGIAFEREMLLVPHAGSSSTADEGAKKGVRKRSEDNWIEKGLTETEVRICQRMSGSLMKNYGYQTLEVSHNALEMAWSYAIFPIKMTAAFLVNLKRMRNIGDTLKRRLTA